VSRAELRALFDAHAAALYEFVSAFADAPEPIVEEVFVRAAAERIPEGASPRVYLLKLAWQAIRPD